MIHQVLQRTVLRITGENRTAFLNRMLTQQLDPDARGQYGCLLEANGQLVACAYWLHRESVWWAFVHSRQAGALAEGLRKYIFFRDAVTIESADEQTLQLNPETGGTYIDSATPSQVVSWSADVAQASDDPHPFARRRAGIPVAGIEVRSGDHVLEWDMGYALAQKGCYVGQEVVERMWSRARRARGRVVVESRLELSDGQTFEDPQFGNLEVRAPILDPHSGLWLALGLCKAVPPPDQPVHTNSGLSISHPPLNSALPASLSQSYNSWAGL